MAASFHDKVDFVGTLARKKSALDETLEDNKLRAEFLEKEVGGGLDGYRDELRQAMTFSVQLKDGSGTVQSMDEKGQRESIESGDVRDRYKALDPETLKSVAKALKVVIDKSERMAAEKSPRWTQDKPVMLFTATQIIEQLFTPLIREGLMPDNLAPDDKSPTAQMLNAVFRSYQEMLQRQKEEREQQLSQADTNYHNAGTRTERLQSLGLKVSAYAEGQLSVVAKRVNMTPEELKRTAALYGKGAKVLAAGAKAFTDAKALDRRLNGQNDTKLQDFLESMKPPQTQVVLVNDKLGHELVKIGLGPATVNDVLQAITEDLYRLGWSLEDMTNKAQTQVLDVLKKFAKLIESNGTAISLDVAMVLITGVGGGLEMAGIAGERYKAGVDMDLAVRQSELRTGVRDLAVQLQDALQRSLLPFGHGVATSIAACLDSTLDVTGLYTMIEPSLSKEPGAAPQSDQVVKVIADALEKALTQADSRLAKVGEALGKSYYTHSSGEISRLAPMLRDGELADPANCLLPLVVPLRAAAQQVCGLELHATLLLDPALASALRDKASASQLLEQQAELEKAEQEMEDFERSLVLMDEGGLDSARQQSLDQMIAQLKSDQQDLEIVLKAGSLFSGFGGGVTKLGTDARNVDLGKSVAEQGMNTATKTVATQVAQSMLPAMEAAELVMKMSVTIVKIARRASLATKFKADVQKAKKAGSYLLPSIENFYDAKVQQQMFAAIELALQVVQLAGAVCATVPEPITMAVGRALNSAAKAGEATRDYAQAKYKDKQLKDGWKVTLDAINNPGNRRLGLEALHSNSTLAVHSIAWAATKGDVMAQEILRSCNVNAQTLADEGTDKDKIIQYLETLLNEDLQFKDEAKLNLDWVPQPLQLTYAGWFTLTARAKQANPPLADVPATAVESAIKVLDSFPPLHTVLAHPDRYSEEALRKQQDALKRVQEVLDEHNPRAADTSVHAGMQQVCRRLAGMAKQQFDEIEALRVML